MGVSKNFSFVHDMMLYTGILAVLVGATSARVPATLREDDYCALNKSHTMCQYQGPSDDCAAETISRVFTDVGKDSILEALNDLRRAVVRGKDEWGDNSTQPVAANMKKITWSDELATVAQRWADQCLFKHDMVRLKKDGSYVGQNIKQSSLSETSKIEEINMYAGDAVYDWFAEVESPGFNKKNIKPFHSVHGTGHYTQVVWAETNQVGCGYVYFKTMVKGSWWYKTLTVCNFWPAGNVRGKAMYEVGKPCAFCGGEKDEMAMTMTSVRMVSVLSNIIKILLKI